MLKRSSGVLMHISSLPGEYGIGTFGKNAMKFIDFLKESGCSYWQVLPFGPTDGHNSPYASLSAFAGNLNFIDPELLFEDGLLTEEELQEEKYANPYTAAFEFLNIHKIPLLYKAYTRIDEKTKLAVEKFAKENEAWLSDYALYAVLKEANLGKEWYDWEDEGLKLHEKGAVDKALQKYRDTVDFIAFMQYIFFEQWKKIKAYASENKIGIIGDLPMYVSLASSDAWANRKLFDLNEDGKPNCVAGVPPDYFSEDGQMWGNPLYNWEEMAKDGYSWWMKRLEASFALFDVVRIDHFRAFSAYWSIPKDALTAKEGKWIKGPRMDFFDKVIAKFGKDRIIAEDLGDIDDDVVKLIEDTEFPCMRVMQFGFDSTNNMHLPHNHPKNSVAYTGTHDNNTALGWLWEATPEEREAILDYCAFPGGDWALGGFSNTSVKAMIRTLWSSPANTVVVPIQDLCGFGKDTKMNVPGVPNGNWAFRISEEQLDAIDTKWIKRLNEVYHR